MDLVIQKKNASEDIAYRQENNHKAVSWFFGENTVIHVFSNVSIPMELGDDLEMITFS